MSSHSREFLTDLVEQIGQSNEILDHRHYRLLLNLKAVEKHALAKAAIEWNWNVGSVIVMKFLQSTCILSMSDFMANAYNQNPENAQLIFNDLLETEYILLADVVKHALVNHANSIDPTGLSLCDLLNEGFKRLCNDVIENPNLLAKNYLIELDEYIQGQLKEDEFHAEICLIHLKLILQEGPKHSIEDSIVNQFTWNQEITDDHTVFRSFLNSIVGNDFSTRQKTLEEILDKCNEWQKQNWKHLLLLLRMTVEKEEYQKCSVDERNIIKAKTRKYLKDTFRKSVSDEDENGFYVMFLIARQITRYNETIIGDYVTWFKDTIGEMKYYLKNPEFSLAMEFLAGMVMLESDIDILNVHINTYIPAATRCNDVVLNYKQLCRSRQMHLTNPSAEASAMIEDADVFSIDDD